MFNNMMYVYEVYKEKSFSKAATNLYISQPSLSATVKKVESKIGAPLFDRSTNPVKLTECGEEYIKCVEKIIDIENDFSHYVNDLNDLATGYLVIGSGNFFSSYILPPLITRYMQKYPKVTVKLVESNTPRIGQRLSDGSLDLIMDNYDFDERMFKKSFCYEERLLFAARAELVKESLAWEYALSARDIMENRHINEATPAVPLACLAHLPFVLLRQGNDTRVRAEKMFAQSDISPQLVLKLDQLATAFHVACNGIGATLLSDTLIKKMPLNEEMVYFKIDSKYARRNTYFYYKKGKYVSRSMEELLKMATELYSGPDAQGGQGR